MKPNNSSVNNLILALLASLTIGLAPFYPEPHIIGKLNWIAGGGHQMQVMDYADLLMHGLPWLFLIYYTITFIQSNLINKSRIKK